MGKVVRTVCQGCHSECGVLVHVESGKIKRIKGDPDHPYSRGYICVKGIHYAHFVYHADRLKYPLKRARGRDLLEGVKRNGAKLIFVDPRRT